MPLRKAYLHFLSFGWIMVEEIETAMPYVLHVDMIAIVGHVADDDAGL
jgi:hypothetical protein